MDSVASGRSESFAYYPQAVIFSDCVACAHAHAYPLTYNNLLTKNQPITVPLLLSESLGM